MNQEYENALKVIKNASPRGGSGVIYEDGKISRRGRGNKIPIPEEAIDALERKGKIKVLRLTANTKIYPV